MKLKKWRALHGEEEKEQLHAVVPLIIARYRLVMVEMVEVAVPAGFPAILLSGRIARE
ncbi:hypothetical protein [Pedobacter sp. MC2016-24]|uniref:hypothetical protein n=1 Tax=Pedobacter sp. MC2016-24 TaxID=2780090 RepID=UPI0018825D1E|nr:hypothetical protein [Pedobacter sp. MC2016-24]MBE9598657.1 hypothetical protein [Pedobacter sp. MC2016-24]